MRGIIPALLLIIIEEMTEYFAFDTSPAGQAGLESLSIGFLAKHAWVINSKWEIEGSAERKT